MAKKSLLYSCLAVDSSAFSPFLLYFGEKVDYVLLVNCGEGEGRGIKMADRSSWRFVERRYFFDIFLKKFLKNKWIVWYGLVNWDQWINVDGKNVWYSTIYCLTSPENEKISTILFLFFHMTVQKFNHKGTLFIRHGDSRGHYYVHGCRETGVHQFRVDLSWLQLRCPRRCSNYARLWITTVS